MPQATCRFRVLWILHVRAHEVAREIHNGSPTCKGLQFARNRSIMAYCYCLHLILALIFTWMFYLQDQRETHKGQLHEQQLLHIVDDLCHFILHKAVNIDGDFVHPEHELAIEKNMKASVSGTFSTSVLAPIALIRGNRTKSCILWALWWCMYCNDAL